MAEHLRLKKSNCKNCYKCIRNCPVKSIRFSAGHANIIGNECILCGHCFVVCPQEAKEIVDEREKVRVLINSGDPVVVSLAPSFIANYDGAGIESMRAALKQLGFYDVEETALGATMVKREYDRMLVEENRDIVITSCCHSINLLIRKYFKSLLPCLANVATPMYAHCADIKRRIPGARTVFIGPCVAKKDEGELSGNVVDAVLTFEELTEWMNEENISPEKVMVPDDESRARFFPTTGGIIKTMECAAEEYSYFAIDGVNNCIAALQDIERGNIHKCFIEMSACPGGCIGGPVMEKYHPSPVKDYMMISSFAGNKDFAIDQPTPTQMKYSYGPIDTNRKTPSEVEIGRILREMGKYTPGDELNCGFCGYNSCRDKAVAIYQGKADISMCLPFLMEKAESFSEAIVKNTPNALIVVNDQLEIQQINDAAMHLLNIRQQSDVMGDYVDRILDSTAFINVMNSGLAVRNQRVYLAEYSRYVDQTLIPAENGRIILCIMRDVTSEMKERKKKEEISRETAEVADRVVDKQMRIVQEIASLLGETAAETKIALSKLKESLADE